MIVQYPSGTSSRRANASIVAATVQIGAKSLVSCFCRAALTFETSTESMAGVSDTSARWMGSILLNDELRDRVNLPGRLRTHVRRPDHTRAMVHLEKQRPSPNAPTRPFRPP